MWNIVRWWIQSRWAKLRGTPVQLGTAFCSPPHCQGILPLLQLKRRLECNGTSLCSQHTDSWCFWSWNWAAVCVSHRFTTGAIHPAEKFSSNSRVTARGGMLETRTCWHAVNNCFPYCNLKSWYVSDSDPVVFALIRRKMLFLSWVSSSECLLNLVNRAAVAPCAQILEP